MVPIPTRRRMPCAVSSLLFATLLAAQAHAQSPTTTTRPDPLDPKAQVPSVRYESAFTQFRRAGDDKPVPWREANDVVTRIGGWRVYAREAQQPDPAAAEKPAAPARSPAATSTPTPPSVPAAKQMPAAAGHKH